MANEVVSVCRKVLKNSALAVWPAEDYSVRLLGFSQPEVQAGGVLGPVRISGNDFVDSDALAVLDGDPSSRRIHGPGLAGEAEADPVSCFWQFVSVDSQGLPSVGPALEVRHQHVHESISVEVVGHCVSGISLQSETEKIAGF